MASHAGDTSSSAQPAPPPASAAPAGTTATVASSSWTEPPWSGWIETTGDALIILEAARRGLIPRVTRRLVDAERKMITSGSVFVFDEDESGIKRWTDGFFWSPSRILGNFLLYRETDKRGAGHRGRSDNHESSSSSLLVNEHGQFADNKDQQSLSRPKGELSNLGLDKQRERSLVGSLTNSYKFKPDGMMKKTFSLTIGGVSQHLISYYKIEDVEQGRLRTPSSLPELASLDISPEYLDKTHFRNPPKVDYDIDGVPRYRGEADEAEPSPRATVSAPLSTGQPLLLESRSDADSEFSSGKRSKRYEPYSAGTKRSRKKGSTQTGSTDVQPGVAQSPTSAVSGQPPPGAFTGADTSHPHYAPYGSYYPHGMPYQMPPHMYNPAPSGPPYPNSANPGDANNANGNGAGPTSNSPPPSVQASGPVSTAPGPGPTQMAYPGYVSADGTPQSTYTFYPPPSGHYAPYGGMGWPAAYAYGPPQSLAAAASAGVGKTEEVDGHIGMPGSVGVGAQPQQVVTAEES